MRWGGRQRFNIFVAFDNIAVAFDHTASRIAGRGTD
jgi:hypothetical protein